MNCPRCRSEIVEPVKFCLQCGFHFDAALQERMDLFFALRNQRRGLAQLSENLRSSLATLDNNLGRFHQLLERDLQTSAAKAPAVATLEPKVPVAAAPPLVQAAAAPAPDVPPAAKPAPAAPATPPPAGHAQPATVVQASRARAEVEVKLGQRLILALGIVVTVFGVGYFLKYSFEQGWIGPAFRVALAYLLGIGALGIGEATRKKGYAGFAYSVLGFGIAVLYFATFAGFQIYPLFPQPLAFGFMVLTTALACLLAVLHDNKWLAVVGLIGGFLTPILLTTGVDNQIALMSYMTLLNLGLLAIALRKRWLLVTALGFAATYILFSAWMIEHYKAEKFWPAILFLHVFFLIYTIMPFVHQYLHGKAGRAAGAFIIVPNTVLAFCFSWGMIADQFAVQWLSVSTVFYAVVFLLMATFLLQKENWFHNAFVFFVTMAAFALIVTVPALFSNHWISVFWAVQAAGLFWLGLRLARPSLTLIGMVLLVTAAFRWICWDYTANFDLDPWSLFIPAGFASQFGMRLLMALLVLAVIWLLAWLCRRDGAGSQHASLYRVLRVLLLAGFGTLLFTVLNIETSAFFHDYLPRGRFAAISVLWTLFSVTLIILGFRRRLPALRVVAIVLFVCTVGKVFLFDMAEVQTAYRIASFIVLGFVLMGVSFLYYRFKDVILKAAAPLKGESEKTE
jgi:uncharacterized membrane protein